MNSDQVDSSSLREEILSTMEIAVQPLNYVLVTPEQMEAYGDSATQFQVALALCMTLLGAALAELITALTLSPNLLPTAIPVTIVLIIGAMACGVLGYFPYQANKKAKERMWGQAQTVRQDTPREDQYEELGKLEAMNQYLRDRLGREMVHSSRLETQIQEQQEREQEEVDIFGEADEADDEFGPIPEGENIFGDQ